MLSQPGDAEVYEAVAWADVVAVPVLTQNTGAQRAVIALKAKYAGARKALAEPAARAGIELLPLDDFYPAGDEHVIVQQVTGRIVPAGGIPLDVGVVVSNVGTLINVARPSTAGNRSPPST